jgi:DNA repair exonuclease SbcCD ATPase subunit
LCHLPAAERDELREAIDALLQRLDAANEMIERSSSNVANLEAQLAAVAAERQQAQEAAGAAQAEAQQLQEALADMQVRVCCWCLDHGKAKRRCAGQAWATKPPPFIMQWKCGLLQQLSDLTLQQNEDKAATLQTLLETESMLDAAGVEASGDGSDDDAGIC